MEVCCVGTWIWRSEMLARSPSTAPSGLCDLHKSLDGSEPRSPPLRESLGACSGRAPVGRSLSSGRQRALLGGSGSLFSLLFALLCPSVPCSWTLISVRLCLSPAGPTDIDQVSRYSRMPWRMWCGRKRQFVHSWEAPRPGGPPALSLPTLGSSRVLKRPCAISL